MCAIHSVKKRFVIIGISLTLMQTQILCSEHKLGRARFIILDKMDYLLPKINSTPSTPDNVPRFCTSYIIISVILLSCMLMIRLFDLIRVKDKSFLVAFYYALRDTLVTKTFDQAVRYGL